MPPEVPLLYRIFLAIPSFLVFHIEYCQTTHLIYTFVPYSESLVFLPAGQQDRLHICADVCLPEFLFVLSTLPSLEDKHPRRWVALAYGPPPQGSNVFWREERITGAKITEK